MLRLMRMCVWNSVLVWISYRSFWQKWNFISGDKISCKHCPRWNAYTCPLEYRVVLKCNRNETSCEPNLFSCWFEISNWYIHFASHLNSLIFLLKTLIGINTRFRHQNCWILESWRKMSFEKYLQENVPIFLFRLNLSLLIVKILKAYS